MQRRFKLLIGGATPSQPASLSAAGMLSAAVIWIAIVLLSVQIFKPFRYAYEYDSAIVLSGNRLRQLNAHIDATARGDRDVRITLRIAADAEQGRPTELTAGIPNLHARHVTVRTPTPADAAQLSQLLSAASFVQDVEAAAALRKAARWNRHCTDVFEHQLANSLRAADRTHRADAKTSTIKLASASAHSPLRIEGDGVSLAETLEAKLNALRKDQAELDRKLTQRQGFAAGVLSVSKPWRIRVIPAETDRLRLLVALAGSLAAAFTATTVSVPARLLVRKRSAGDVLRRQLTAMGIEVLPGVGQSCEPAAMRSGPVAHAAAYDWIYRASKGLIILTLALAAARLLFDPLWRDLCLDSPLAAVAALADVKIGRA